MANPNITYTVQFAQMAVHVLGRKPAPKPKTKTTKKAESRAILLHANGCFIGVFPFTDQSKGPEQ